MFFAHSENALGVKHDLGEHLVRVADLARGYAEKLGAPDLAYWAGLWHDLGKFHPDFQSYISHPETRKGPDHSSAGSVHAALWFGGLAFLIAGHHGGLPALTALKLRLREKSASAHVERALDIARTQLPRIDPTEQLAAKCPSFLTPSESAGGRRGQLQRDTELFLRMLFSALVDADFLDTEAHFDDERAGLRAGSPSLQELCARFEANQASVTGRKADALSAIRHEIYQACVAAGDEPPGVFSLTVPTGGGKTRSGMAFALRHALRHELDRVIVAIPYTSIIEQTVDVYRQIFGNAGVLEHHSAVTSGDDASDPVSRQDLWARLASENWTAPIVVTTTVQLFESLFARRPSNCRKLHNIARSVLILDEVQTLPTHLLSPILDALQQLVDHYHVTVLLCTATQPALREGAYVQGLRDIREVVPDPARYFQALRRVRYECHSPVDRWSWGRVAEEMRTQSQALAIVNTKPDAFALLDALNDPAALHLSTQMCGVHRRDTLSEVRRRLAVGEPCRLVSTQVIEAGVDVDFPLVLRAIGPLDRIVQAAGRCNREGRLPVGRVVIFHPASGGSPRGAYEAGANTAATLLAAGADLHEPATYETYFTRLYQVTDLDGRHIQACREALDYPEVAARFRMIEDDSSPAIVRTVGREGEVEALVALVSDRHEAPRWALRRLQPYLVSIRSRLIPEYERKGLLQEIAPGLWEWLGRYDPVRGLVEGARAPEELVV